MKIKATTRYKNRHEDLVKRLGSAFIELGEELTRIHEEADKNEQDNHEEKHDSIPTPHDRNLPRTKLKALSDSTDQAIKKAVEIFLDCPLLKYEHLVCLKHLLILVNVELSLSTQQRFSGPNKEKWEKAPESQKYVTAIETDHEYTFYTLPLAERSDDIVLALYTSLFYHNSRHTWESRHCRQLRQIITKVDKELLEDSSNDEDKLSEDKFHNRYIALETEAGYYGECLSSDSDEEQCDRFSSRNFTERNALLESTKKIMQYGQVAVAKRRRAEIHYDQPPDISVRDDLATLNRLFRENKGQLTKEHLNQVATPFFIAQYRGLHFDTYRWSQKSRRQYRQNFKGNAPNYAEAVYKKAGLSLPYDTERKMDEGDEQKLLISAIKLKHQIICLSFTGQIKGFKVHATKKIAEYSIKSSTDTFFHAADALQQFYTGDYDCHRQACEIVADKKEKSELVTTSQEAILLFSTGSENYNLSTGDAPYHPLRYATGIKFYGQFKEKRLRPRWHNTGIAERPYSGCVETYLLTPEEYFKSHPRHIISMNAKSSIVVDYRIIPERETTFPVMLPDTASLHTVNIKYPNFSREYEDYHKYRYGLDKKTYTEFRNKITNSKPHEKERKSIKMTVGEHLCDFHEASLIENARVAAYNKGLDLTEGDQKPIPGWLIYRGYGDEFRLYDAPPLYPKNNGKGAQAEAGKIQVKEKQARHKKRKNSEASGELEKMMREYNILASSTLRLVLENFYNVIPEVFTEAQNRQEVYPAPSWKGLFKEEVFDITPSEIKNHLQEQLNFLLRVSNLINCEFIIISFLFKQSEELKVSSQNSTNSYKLVYFGGDGFYGLQKKDEKDSQDSYSSQKSKRSREVSPPHEESSSSSTPAKRRKITHEITKSDKKRSVEDLSTSSHTTSKKAKTSHNISYKQTSLKFYPPQNRSKQESQEGNSIVDPMRWTATRLV